MQFGKDDDSRRQSPQSHQQPPWLNWVIWLLALPLVLAAWSYLNRTPQAQELSYTAFKQQVREGNVERITIQGHQVRGQLQTEGESAPDEGAPRAGQAGANGGSRPFTTTIPPIAGQELMTLLESHDVTIRAETAQPSFWSRLLIAILPWIILFAVFMFVLRKMRERMGGGGAGQLFSFGKSRAKRVTGEMSDVKLDQVAGAENAKRDVQEIIDFLKEPRRYHSLGATLPKGALLLGPPGTGKTLLAKAVAGEAGVPFFSIGGSEFIEMFVGVGASRVRDMFAQAKEASPAIIFIDEIDAIGRSRGMSMSGGHDEREQTLNQILSEMDGFSPRETVVVMAATNRPDVLDPALLRPGRFDRKIHFELPSRRARQAILEVHARKVSTADDMDLESLAARTIGFSGADLANLINEAAMLAAREHRERVDNDQLNAAYNRIVLGEKREDLVDPAERRVIAFHESGHALMARLLKQADPVDKVTIIPRGRALGATQQTPERERYNLSQSYLRSRICVMLGGRGAEKLVFGETSTGAAQDLKQATQMARRMVADWGMSATFGPAAFADGDDSGTMNYAMGQRQSSEYTAKLIDEETRRIMSEAEDGVDEALGRHREHLEKLANALLERETIDAAEMEELLGS